MKLRGVFIALARVMLAAAAAGVFWAMLGPYSLSEIKLVPWDKAAHFIAFYGLTLILFAGFPAVRRWQLATLAVVVGCVIEASQMITGRDAEWSDVVADTLGILAVVGPMIVERMAPHIGVVSCEWTGARKSDNL